MQRASAMLARRVAAGSAVEGALAKAQGPKLASRSMSSMMESSWTGSLGKWIAMEKGGQVCASFQHRPGLLP